METTMDTQRIYEGKILNLRRDTVELPNGNTAKREIVEHAGGVCVVAIDREDNLLMVSQYRHPFEREVLELPAGKLLPGEDPAVCGRRELKEETGYEAGQYEFLCELLPTPAYDTEVIRIFFATDLSYGEQELDPDEFLDVIKVPFDQALQMVLDNRIKDAKTQIGILKYKLLRDSGQLLGNFLSHPFSITMAPGDTLTLPHIEEDPDWVEEASKTPVE